MNSNVWLFIGALAIVFILSIIWNIVYSFYLRKQAIRNVKNYSVRSNTAKNKVLSVIKPDMHCSDFNTVCPVVLPNTDDSVSDALEYIRPSKFANELLENLYGQTRI